MEEAKSGTMSGYDSARCEIGALMQERGVPIPEGDNSVTFLVKHLIESAAPLPSPELRSQPECLGDEIAASIRAEWVAAKAQGWDWTTWLFGELVLARATLQSAAPLPGPEKPTHHVTEHLVTLHDIHAALERLFETCGDRLNEDERYRGSTALMHLKALAGPEKPEPTPIKRLLEATSKLHHWHDWGRNNEGMVVSSDVVREIWEARDKALAESPTTGQPHYEWTPEVEKARSFLLAHFADQFSMEVIATAAYILGGKAGAVAQPATPSRDWIERTANRIIDKQSQVSILTQSEVVNILWEEAQTATPPACIPTVAEVHAEDPARLGGVPGATGSDGKG